MTQRTPRQNRALHLFFKHVSEKLNAGGYNVQLVLKEKMDIDWTPALVKEVLWRPAQKVILKKKSTTELEKQRDIDTVYEHLNRHLGEKFGVHVPWPHFENEQEFINNTTT